MITGQEHIQTGTCGQTRNEFTPRRKPRKKYEALYGRGQPVEPKKKAGPVKTSEISSGGLGGGRSEPPRLFTDVAERLGFTPPNELPRAPQSIPPEVDLPVDRPPDFWDPKEEGDFKEAKIRPGFPDLQELEIEGLPEGEWGRAGAESWREPGPPHGYTPDSIAYYMPWHIGGNDHWGIYFRVPRMKRYIERIEREFGRGNLAELIVEQVFWHEMEHFEQELAATALEDLLGQILYPQWLSERHLIPVELLDRRSGHTTDVWMIEEALATAREIEEVEKPKNRGKYPGGYVDYMKWDSMSRPTGYNRFYLCLGGEAKQEARAAFIESVASVAQSPLGRVSPETANRLFGRRATSRIIVPVYHVMS